MPLAQIAKQLNVSTGTVRLHYQKLVEKGAIRIHAITNPLRIGQSRMAMIGINVQGRQLREAVEEISNFEEVIYLVILTGSYDLFAEVVCRSKEHLLNFLTEKLSKVEGVEGTETFMYLELAKEDYS